MNKFQRFEKKVNEQLGFIFAILGMLFVVAGIVIAMIKIQFYFSSKFGHQKRVQIAIQKVIDEKITPLEERMLDLECWREDHDQF
jgi:mannose/fructose/N-acetylgalactosamine-specific phosphotransferase system component IID